MDPDRAGTQSRIERLEEIAAELETVEDEATIYERAVTAAEELVSFDACGVFTAEDGRLVPKAATDTVLHVDATPRSTDSGIAGRTVETGQTQVVDDVRTDAEADPSREAYRSVISVPLGEDGVVQVIATEPDAFDETDREIAELLVDHVEHALDRVRYEAAVERERDRFVALFQNVPDAAVQYTVADGEPVIDRVNSAFVRLFGFEPEEAIGASTLSLLVPEDDREAARELYDRVRDGERLDREVTRETTDGERPFLLRSVPVPSEDGGMGYFIYTDIAEMKQRQRELERKNERLDAFASVVSHDLRNPLTVAMGFAEHGTETGDPDHYERIAAELDRMDEMIDDLLTLARSGDVVGDPVPVDVATIARRAWSHVDTPEATLSVEIDRSTSADPDRLLELFENLYRNAIEHGRADATVTVGTLDGDRPGFFVDDDGPGIPEEHREEVLDRGFSTSSDGTGFGLAIVDEIVQAHDWSIDVTESEPGGARFEVETGT